MIESLTGAAASMSTTADALANAAARMPNHDPGAMAFGADAPGRLGQLGRELHRHVQRSLDVRRLEAAALGARLVQVADALVEASVGYADTDDASSQRAPKGA